MAVPVRREALTVGLLCVAWYVASSCSNVVGKVVLSQLPLPVTLSVVQLGATAACSGPALAACGVRRAGWPAGVWRRLLPLAAAKFLTTLCSQVSIWKVPISYAHTVKATTPLWTAALGWVLWRQPVGREVLLSLVLIAAGVAVASATELQFDAGGLGAALAAAALLSLQHLYSKRLLNDTAGQVHHLRLLQTLSQLALVMFVPVWAWSDAGAVWARVGTGDWRLWSLVAADGVLAWAQAVAAFSVLSRVTPLGYAVASAAKRAAVVAASLLVLRNPAPPLNLAGMALAAAGVLAYNRAKIHARSADTARRPLLPV